MRREPGSQAPRLPAFGPPRRPGRLPEDHASGRIARPRRPGRGRRRRRPAWQGQGRFARRHGAAGRPAGGLRLDPQPLALRAPTRRRLPAPRPAMPSRRLAGRSGPAPGRLVSPSWGPRAAMGAAGQGARAAADPDASPAGASARFPGSAKRAPLRVRWPGGLGCGRLQAHAKQGERVGGTFAASSKPGRFPTPRRGSKAASGASLEAT